MERRRLTTPYVQPTTTVRRGQPRPPPVPRAHSPTSPSPTATSVHLDTTAPVLESPDPALPVSTALPVRILPHPQIITVRRGTIVHSSRHFPHSVPRGRIRMKRDRPRVKIVPSGSEYTASIYCSALDVECFDICSIQCFGLI